MDRPVFTTLDEKVSDTIVSTSKFLLFDYCEGSSHHPLSSCRRHTAAGSQTSGLQIKSCPAPKGRSRGNFKTIERMGPLGAAYGVPNAFDHAQYYCSRGSNGTCVCWRLRYRLDRSCNCYIECTTSRRHDIFFSKCLHFGLLCFPPECSMLRVPLV